MKDYLKAIIIEQINRGLCLKKLIPHPLKYPELSSLAERCQNIIDSSIQQLEFLSQELERRDENDVRDIFRGIRRCVRSIELAEYFGISALYYQNDEIGYMNRLIFRIHREINLPLNPPSVACISTKYYYYSSFTNVIFVPVGESNFLLHLPDAFHEIGHEVLFNRENELRLKKINEAYLQAIGEVTDFYGDLLRVKKRETGPKNIPLTIQHIHSQWKEYWINEFFCDLFALYTLGPAYAWSHLHLVSKKSDDIYEFSSFLPMSHPSDESRARMLTLGLTKLGFNNEKESFLSKWKYLPLVIHAQPVIEYQYAYPNDLMEKVATLILEGVEKSGFSIVSPQKLSQNNDKSIVSLLNNAWKVFWDRPNDFRKWEEEAIQKLKSIL